MELIIFMWGFGLGFLIGCLLTNYISKKEKKNESERTTKDFRDFWC